MITGEKFFFRLVDQLDVTVEGAARSELLSAHMAHVDPSHVLTGEFFFGMFGASSTILFFGEDSRLLSVSLLMDPEVKEGGEGLAAVVAEGILGQVEPEMLLEAARGSHLLAAFLAAVGPLARWH